MFQEQAEFPTAFSPTGQGVGDSLSRHHFEVTAPVTPALTPQTQDRWPPTERTFKPPPASWDSILKGKLNSFHLPILGEQAAVLERKGLGENPHGLLPINCPKSKNLPPFKRVRTKRNKIKGEKKQQGFIREGSRTTNGKSSSRKHGCRHRAGLSCLLSPAGQASALEGYTAFALLCEVGSKKKKTCSTRDTGWKGQLALKTWAINVLEGWFCP